MKLHRPLITAAAEALSDIFRNGKQSEDVVERTIRSDKRLGARDRHFVASAVYDTARFYRLFAWCAGDTENPAAWLGAKLILDDLYENAAAFFPELNADTLKAKKEEAMGLPAVRESVEDWLYLLGERELGAQWETELHALNQQARVVIRTNTLITDRDSLRAKLKAAGIETEISEFAPEALVLRNRVRLQSQPLFREGNFEVQDVNSQRVAEAMQLTPGLSVLDACAGGGGKTLHIAAKLNNRGSILATDIRTAKLKTLLARAHRSHARIVRIAEYIPPGSLFDRVLVDAPCSGTGVLRRKPDPKWRLTPHGLNELFAAQQELLRIHANHVKPGGLLTYSTCSILPSENEMQTTAFLQAVPEFEKVFEESLSPAVTGFDGFYVCVMRRRI